MPDSLIPGAQLGDPGIVGGGGLAQGAEWGFNQLLDMFNQNPTIAPPPLGPKMPTDAKVKADQAVAGAVNAVQKKADTANPLFSFLGLPGTTWRDVGVFSVLALLFIVGVIMLMNAAGIKK